jgi:AraC family transcriptional regulator
MINSRPAFFISRLLRTLQHKPGKMRILNRGDFFGDTNQTDLFGSITTTDTVYTHDHVDWHYHENAYFTFILEGKVREVNKKESYDCTAGSLLFHHWEEPHYNLKPPGFTRGFHVELPARWFIECGLDPADFRGSTHLRHPTARQLMYRILNETKNADIHAGLAIQALLLETFSVMQSEQLYSSHGKPAWVSLAEQLLRSRADQPISLTELSVATGIHPSHLSREFSRYFNCNIGEYLRRLRIEKALTMIPDRQKSLTSIGYDCGFYDQGHFTKVFRQLTGLTPSAYRKVLQG